MGHAENLYRNSRRNNDEKGREGLWFPRGFPAQQPYRAVHYFLMSNKAISMCPDQGPQVLTRVISPESPACATSSSEKGGPSSLLLSLPLSVPCAGRWRSHVTILHPPETRDARCGGRARAWIGKKMATRRRGRGSGLEGEKSRGEKAVSTSEGASKGNFTKADPLVMNVI